MSITPDPITAGLMRIQDTERVKRLGRSTKKRRGVGVGVGGVEWRERRRATCE